MLIAWAFYCSAVTIICSKYDTMATKALHIALYKQVNLFSIKEHFHEG